MTLALLRFPFQTMRIPHAGRWLALVIASLLLHLALVNWLGAYLHWPTQPGPAQSLVAATLLANPPLAVDAPLPPAHSSRTEPAANMLPLPTRSETGTSDNAPPQADNTQHRSANTGAVGYPVKPPPSVELQYAVQVLRHGQIVSGNGKLAWQFDGTRYAITGETDAAPFSALNFSSEGEIDEFGIAPRIYSEKRQRKPLTNTHFQRERQLISFSASSASYPRSGGAQDRASIVWQLAGLARASPGEFVPGAQIDIFVAGVRDGDVWNVHVLRQEEIELPAGRIQAWHIVRPARPDTYEQKIDIWLAPQQEWYPVKMRYTDRNGDFVDLSLSQIIPTTVR